MANGTTTTDPYSKALMQTLGGTPGQPGAYGTGLGFSPSDIAQMQAAGIGVSDLQSLNLVGAPTTTTTGPGGAQIQPNQAWTPQQQQNAALVRMMMKLGGGGQQQQQPPPANAYGQAFPMYAVDEQGNPTGKPTYANPTDLAGLLGAAALGSPYVKNQAPSAALDPRSGVSKVGGPLISANVPMVPGQQVTWTSLAQANGLTQNDIAEFQKTGLGPADVAHKFGLNLTVPQPQTAALGGPWSTQPGIFVSAARTAPTQAPMLGAAVQPTATAYNPAATPFAQAPPAPGLQIPQNPQLLAAHTNALADAGKALFAHFGGDPNSAGPADIANFHSQLTSTLAAAPQPTAAKKMASGGVVPGRGNEDTVPALLTPGEYVIPRPQVQQLMRTGRLPIKMAEGGTVQDPDPDPNAPPEARRTMLSAQTSQAQPPAAPGGSSVHPGLTSGLATAAHTYANSINNFAGAGTRAGTGGGGTPYYSPGQNVWIGASPGAGQSGFAYANQTAAAADPGATGKGAIGMGGGQLQSALGGIGSGLSQAAQAIASSVKPWQMQQSAIPAPPPAPPAPQFTQPQVPQQAQGAANPYAAYVTNEAKYPTSPYYT
jgi:hypothetical protein